MSAGKPPRWRGRRRGNDGAPVVPDAEFGSYYGRPVLKAAPWDVDIPSYLFLGGLAAGSSVLGAGADLSGMPVLRRAGRLGAVGAISLSVAALVHDLGRPQRFAHMLRVAKPTSPMSVGTWLITGYGPLAGLAAAGELGGLVPRRLARLLGGTARPAGLGAAALAPALASYTAVLLSDTAAPAWHEAYRELPFVFAGSAAAAAGGLGMCSSADEQGRPARRMALAGAIGELVGESRMESSMRSTGVAAETLHQGKAGSLMRIGKTLTVAGASAAGALETLGFAGVRASRMRWVSVLGGAALAAGSACTRFGIFEAGQHSARDPKYTIVPQRERHAHTNERPSR
jgi:formate-dependent nitrite reductase membrane component NrfD